MGYGLKQDSGSDYYYFTNVPPYVISFDSDDDSLPDMYTDDTGLLTGPLPLPSREEYIFDGWYTSWYGNGEKIEDSYTFHSNTYLYASWIPISTD